MKRIATFGSLVVIATLLTGCAVQSGLPAQSSDTKANITNPREGWVEVQPYAAPDSDDIPTHYRGIWKKCDGNTLIYMSVADGRSTSISTVPNSPECQG
jgi:hypothetical protein